MVIEASPYWLVSGVVAEKQNDRRPILKTEPYLIIDFCVKLCLFALILLNTLLLGKCYRKFEKFLKNLQKPLKNFIVQTKIKGAQYFCVANISLKKNSNFFDFFVILG